MRRSTPETFAQLATKKTPTPSPPSTARATNPNTGGRLTQAPAGTNSTTGQAVVIFKNFEFGGHVPEVSSTSRPSASRRSVPRVVLQLVGGCGAGLRLGGVFSRFVLLAVRIPARKMEEEPRPCGGGVSGPLGARSLCSSWCSRIVFGVVPPLVGRRKSPRLMWTSPSFASVGICHGFLRFAFRRSAQSDCSRGYGKDPRAL